METFNVVVKDYDANVVFRSEDATEIRTESLASLTESSSEYDTYIQAGMPADALFLTVLIENVGLTFPLSDYAVEIFY